MDSTRTTLLGTLLLLCAAERAVAQDEVRGKRAGDLVVGIGAAAVLPQSGGRVDTIGGRPRVGDAGTPVLEATYFVTPNLALNIVAGAPRLSLDVEGSVLGDLRLGHVSAISPALLLQVHPAPQWRASPYVGAGPSVTFFRGYGGALTPPVERVRLDSAPGFVLNAGMDYEAAPNWLLNLDVRRLFVRTDAEVNSGLVRARAVVDPWIFAAALRYRF